MDSKVSKKILIIDDDPFILDMYALKFREDGFQVESARDGKEGLKKIKEYNPEVILLDIVMPVMDGFDVMHQLKKDNIAPNTTVVLLSNLGQKDDVDRGMRLGAHDYIIKAHFTPTEVVNKIKTLIGVE